MKWKATQRPILWEVVAQLHIAENFTLGQIQRVIPVGHKNPIDTLRRIEELILLRFDGVLCLLFGIAQRQEAVGLAPAIGLIEELALLVGIGLWGRLPGGQLQLLDQPRRLARHHDVLPAFLLVSLDGFAAVETGIGAGVDALDALEQALLDGVQMRGDLLPIRPVAGTQLASCELLRLGDKAQNGLIALLAVVLRVIPLARAHSADRATCAPCQYRW